jgi:hypothetical protein
LPSSARAPTVLPLDADSLVFSSLDHLLKLRSKRRASRLPPLAAIAFS